jgi:hypothetical protein
VHLVWSLEVPILPSVGHRRLKRLHFCELFWPLNWKRKGGDDTRVDWGDFSINRSR